MTDLLELAKTVVGWAAPGEEIEAYVARSRTTNIRAYDGAVESLSSAEPIGAGIRVITDRRQGFAWVGSLDEALLKETLEEARDNATFAQPDDYAGLAVPDGVGVAELDLLKQELTATSIDAKIDIAVRVERAARARDPRVTGVRTATYGDSVHELAVVTTTGIVATEIAGSCGMSVSPLLEADGDTQISYFSAAGRVPADLDIEDTAAQAVERGARLLGATKPASRRVTVVLDPDVTEAFLGVIAGTLSGEAVLKGRSLFANREGELVAAPIVTLTSDPVDPTGTGASRYDGEGLARRRLALIEDGRLSGFMYDTYSGRRAGRASTASAVRSYATSPAVGPSAITLAPGDKDPAALIAAIDDGVYVQDVSGLHSGVNPISGDFSVGATGLMIRGGALGAPFREATVASTLQRMLLDVIAVGSDVNWQPGGIAGATLVISDISLGGTS